MVAALNTARLGSGGISIPVVADLDSLRANIANAKQIVAEASKTMKVKVNYDADETAILRGVKSQIKKLEAQINKEQINVRLQQFGILPAPSATPGRPTIANWQPPDSYRTIALAHEEYKKRQNLEAKFSKQLEDEATGGGGGGGAGRVGNLRSLLRGGIYGYAASRIAEGVSGLSHATQGFGVAGSSDPYLRNQGLASGIQGLGSIPVIGNVVKAFDDLLGVTKSLNSQMQTRLDVEHQAVARAQLGGDAFSSAASESAEEQRALQRERESTSRSGKVRSILAGQLFPGLNVFSDMMTKDDLAAQDERQKEIAATAKLRLAYLRVDSNTRIGLNELRVRNRGLHLEDEDALGAIRGVDANITRATTPEGKHRAALEGISSLRALKASYTVRGGGMAASANLRTDLIGDPYNLHPETQARIRAENMTDQALGKLGALGAPQFGGLIPGFGGAIGGQINESLRAMGSARARNLGLDFSSTSNPNGVNNNDSDLAAEGVNTLGQILDIMRGLKLDMN